MIASDKLPFSSVFLFDDKFCLDFSCCLVKENVGGGRNEKSERTFLEISKFFLKKVRNQTPFSVFIVKIMKKNIQS